MSRPPNRMRFNRNEEAGPSQARKKISKKKKLKRKCNKMKLGEALANHLNALANNGLLVEEHRFVVEMSIEEPGPSRIEPMACASTSQAGAAGNGPPLHHYDIDVEMQIDDEETNLEMPGPSSSMTMMRDTIDTDSNFSTSDWSVSSFYSVTSDSEYFSSSDESDDKKIVVNLSGFLPSARSLAL